MLAGWLPTLLPAMTLVEAIEDTRIHSVAGRANDRTAWSRPGYFARPIIPSQMRG
jgi:predicted ATPase with chaperone activity